MALELGVPACKLGDLDLEEDRTKSLSDGDCGASFRPVSGVLGMEKMGDRLPVGSRGFHKGRRIV
jgi:hypothetical protein